MSGETHGYANDSGQVVVKACREDADINIGMEPDETLDLIGELLLAYDDAVNQPEVAE